MILTAQDFKISEYDEETLEMDYTLGEEVINLSIYNDDDELEEILKDVNKVVVQLEKYNAEGKDIIVDELYDVYSEKNEGLSEEQFRDELGLLSLYFTGDGEVEFNYEGGAYFGDHILSIEMVDGEFESHVAMNG
ncbi:hypothetical protein MYRA21_3750 [Myroides sp. A21]|uniref:DUF2262 domain-containing protein n=1 Tax=Myroides sp. A21 TaxID=1583100 RepID=UPI00057D55A9|nr:DUF2262 domain-containing protein [Myroides sp. A21]AJA70836.1 hypothetical protein MYRA21_3750 [Myroides sp. A21]